MVEKHRNGASDKKEACKKYYDEFVSAINDDLNIPLALGVLWNMVKEDASKDIFDLAITMDRVFGLDLEKPYVEEKTDVPQEILDLVEKRKLAKANKDWPTADAIRNQIDALGYTLKDTKDGVEINKK